MQFVIDTSAIIAVLTSEPQRIRLVEMTKGVALIAPSSVHWEIGNAFSAMLKRERATIAQIAAALNAYGRIAIRFVDVDLVVALGICNGLGIYAYDAYLIACAQAQRCPLLSLDRGLIRATKAMGVQVVEVEL